jgi:F-type H+-transporting ATPase subunit a
LPIILRYEGEWFFFLSSKFHHGYDAYRNFRIAADGPKKGKIIRVLDDGVTADANASFVLDLSITKNVFSIMMSCIFLCFVFIGVAKSYIHCGFKRAPRGLSAFLEPLILFVRDDIARSAIPEKKVQTFLPYLLTLFSFIFFNNLLGLVPFFPGGANVTGNISVTLTLALFTFFTLHIFANKDYWKHVFNTPGVPSWLKFPFPLMPIIEVMGVLVKPVVLMLRLFANITAGHMIILGFVSLIFVLGASSSAMGYAISPLSVLFVVFMNFLELLVAFIQAYVFTFFSAIFFGMAVIEEHH